jgi:hypothetical protein
MACAALLAAWVRRARSVAWGSITGTGGAGGAAGWGGGACATAGGVVIAAERGSVETFTSLSTKQTGVISVFCLRVEGQKGAEKIWWNYWDT